MKKYTQNISKLYESVGFEKIESGKTYVTAKGGKVTVKDIYIDATQEIADVFASYEFESTDGTKTEETNKFTVLVDLLRNS